MKLTNYQAFHLSVKMNHLIMDVEDFKYIAKSEYAITIRNADFLDLSKSHLLESMQRRLIEATQDDWNDLESEIELYNSSEDLEHEEITKMTEALLLGLMTNQSFTAEVNELELDGINVVSGAQLLEDFKNHMTIGGAIPDESTNEFKYRIDYKPHGLYIWSDSVEEAVNVESLTVNDLESVGISEAFYAALKNIPSRI